MMPPLPGSVVTLGTFDGVHKGHQALVGKAVLRAEELGVEAVAYTFDPHPAKVLAPRFAPKTLMALDRRVHYLQRLGIQRVVVETFDRSFAALEADTWVTEWLCAHLSPKAIVVGFNFTFGKGRQGNPERLREIGKHHGFEVLEIDAVDIGGLAVSSTKVREFVQNGNVEGAAELLGRPFALTGPIIKGDQRGRRLGFPTANLAADAEILPAHGVYATRLSPVDQRGQELWPAVTNVGLRPTFGGEMTSVETHVLDAEPNLYDTRVQVDFLHRIRNEMRFGTPEALVAQVTKDIEAARRYHTK